MQFSVKKHFGLKEAFLLIVGVLIFAFILKTVNIDFQKTALALQSIPSYFIFAFIGIRAFGYLIGNYKWGILVEKVKKTSFSTLFPIFMAGYILDNLVPGPGFGAEPIKAFYLGRAIKKSVARCFATALMDNILLSFILAGFFGFSVLYMYFYIKIFAVRVAVGILLLAFLVFGLIALYFYIRKDRKENTVKKFLRFIYNLRILGFLKKKYKTFGEFENAFHLGIGNLKGTMGSLWRDRKRMAYVLFLAFVWAAINYIGFYILLLGYGIKANPYALVAIITITDMVGYYSPIPAGTGIIEGGRIPMLAFIGIPAEIAAAATIIDRAVFYIWTYGFGYAALNYVNLKYLR